jgi:large subunit ribosomal protein L29
MKANEIREKSIQDLSSEESKIREELFKLNLRRGLEQLENPKRIKLLKKDLARILTVKNEKIRAGEKV